MKLFWQENKILVISFILMTFITFISFYDSATEEKAKPLAEIISEPRAEIGSNEKTRERNPASVVEKTVIQQQAGSQKTVDSKQKMALSIFCDAKSLRLDSSSQLMTLELTSCASLKEKDQLWIKNETNGFKAQIFTISSKKFKTDFIQLNHGINKLSLLGVLKDGQKVEQTLEILSGL